MVVSTIDKLFDEVDDLEKQVKKKYPKQKGRVILANIKTEIDYEIGKPSDNSEKLRWFRKYADSLKKVLR
jgi:hypothetical protein